MAERRGLKAMVSGLGLGYLPLAPGTWASAAAVGIYLLLRELPAVFAYSALGGLTVALSVAGVALGRAAERLYGAKDPGPFVLDEIAGQWLVLLLFWWQGAESAAVAAFVSFRIFDVVKPFPVRRLEQLGGGLGIVADDLVAALYAAASSWLVCYGFIDRFLLRT